MGVVGNGEIPMTGRIRTDWRFEGPDDRNCYREFTKVR
jgi:hypothetical protein